MPVDWPQRRKPSEGVLVVPGITTVAFVTVCSRHRDPWLAADPVHGALGDAWLEAQAWRVGRYVVMPDHVHVFAALHEEGVEIERWCAYWKRLVTLMLEHGAGRWQSGQFHTRMRTCKHYEEKWEYVRANPVRHGLVRRAEDWAYQGELFEIRW